MPIASDSESAYMSSCAASSWYRLRISSISGSGSLADGTIGRKKPSRCTRVDSSSITPSVTTDLPLCGSIAVM